MVEECGDIPKMGLGFLAKALMVEAWSVVAKLLTGFMLTVRSLLEFEGILMRAEAWRAGLSTARV
jgi:hypothetical protein